MALTPRSTGLSTDYATQLELLCEIERLGGSVGYDADPGAFGELVQVLDPFDTNAWTKAINDLEGNENATEPGTRALKTKLEAELDLHRSDPKRAREQRSFSHVSVIDVIKGIESLGGSVGFQTFTRTGTTNARADVSDETRVPPEEWPRCYASGFIQRTLLVTRLDLFADQHSGTGHAWGPALGVGNLQGALFYSSFDADSFEFGNLSVGARATMRSNGVVTAFFMGALIGVSRGFSLEGDWSW